MFCAYLFTVCLILYYLYGSLWFVLEFKLMLLIVLWKVLIKYMYMYVQLMSKVLYKIHISMDFYAGPLTLTSYILCFVSSVFSLFTSPITRQRQWNAHCLTLC